MQGYRKAEVQGKGKNDKEGKPRVGSRRERWRTKSSDGQKNRNIENLKKIFLGSMMGTEQEGKKKSTGRRMGNRTLGE